MWAVGDIGERFGIMPSRVCTALAVKVTCLLLRSGGELIIWTYVRVCGDIENLLGAGMS